MKRTVIIGLSLIQYYSLSGQTWNNNTVTVKEKTSQVLTINPPETSPGSKKGLPTSVSVLSLIWSDDFSNPANWTITTPVGSGPGKDWVIGTSAPAGPLPIPAILSTTASNGFAMFDSDFNCSYDQVADITTASSIDCSAHPFVRLNFEQQYERYRDSTYVFVSNDGFTWTKYPVNDGLVGSYGYSVNPEKIKVDISATAGGQTTVWIRFQFYSPNTLGFGSGCNYAWMIDDVSITDLSPNDVAIDRAYSDFSYQDGGYYTQTPTTQVAPITFRAAISNQGALAQTTVKLNVSISNGTTTVYNQNSAVLPSFAYHTTDTLMISTPSFTPPNTIKNYTTVFKVSQTEVELPVDTMNSSVTKYFAVTDTVYARDSGIPTGTVSPNTYPGGAVDDARLGLIYEFHAAATASSVSAFIDSSSGIGADAQAKIYELNAGVFSEISSSALYSVSSITSGWINFPLPPTTLNAGTTYLAAITTSGISTGPDLFVVLGDDRSVEQPFGTSLLYVPAIGSWTSVRALPMIRLNVKYPFAGISEKEIDRISICQNAPNPTNGVSVINYELEENGMVTLNLFDLTGKFIAVQNMGEQNSGAHSVKYDATNLCAGVYYYSLTVGNRKSPVMKMVIIE